MKSATLCCGDRDIQNPGCFFYRESLQMTDFDYSTHPRAKVPHRVVQNSFSFAFNITLLRVWSLSGIWRCVAAPSELLRSSAEIWRALRFFRRIMRAELNIFNLLVSKLENEGRQKFQRSKESARQKDPL